MNICTKLLAYILFKLLIKTNKHTNIYKHFDIMHKTFKNEHFICTK